MMANEFHAEEYDREVRRNFEELLLEKLDKIIELLEK
jgi:hypothetical protein